MLSMIAGSIVMLIGVLIGWAMANTQHQNQKVNIHIRDKKDENM